VEDRLAEEMLEGRIKPGDTVLITAAGEELRFENKTARQPANRF
jgi:ATP-dependent Clp protease ATP-binding subunit ClpA